MSGHAASGSGDLAGALAGQRTAFDRSAAKAATYCAALDALDAAKQHASRILSDARAEAEAERQSILRQAHSEQQRLAASAAVEGQQSAARLTIQAARALNREIEALPVAMAEAIANGVAKVLGSLDVSHAVACAAREAVAELADRSRVVVRVAPGNVRKVRDSMADDAEASVRVLGDASQGARDCTIETCTGVLRAGLDQQLELLRTALRVEAARPHPGSLMPAKPRPATEPVAGLAHAA